MTLPGSSHRRSGRWAGHLATGLPIPVAGTYRFLHTAAVNRRLPFFLVLASLAVAAQAQVYRCTGAKGAVTYQEIPCGEAEQARTMNIPSAFPEANLVERNRLLQREAALDARLLERARIESAERVANAELATREKEAKAMREAAELAAQQPVFPAYVVGPAYRGPRVRHHQLPGLPPRRL